MKNPQSDKKASVASMFDSIAGRYDFLNHLLSFGIDRLWRKKAIKIISGRYKNPKILDVACGTGDLAIAAMRLDPEHITGIDISDRMLEKGKKKISRKGLSDKIELIAGDSEKIPFNDNSFDIVMSAFGVRNFTDLLRGLREMNRVLKSGGHVMILEFSKPAGFPFKHIYNLYFLRILPLVGRIFSKHKHAYTYLPYSVMQFPDNENFIQLMKETGFVNTGQKRLSFGIATIYIGVKI